MEQLELFTTLNNEFVYLNQTIIDTEEFDDMCWRMGDLYKEIESADEAIDYYRELNGDN